MTPRATAILISLAALVVCGPAACESGREDAETSKTASPPEKATTSTPEHRTPERAGDPTPRPADPVVRLRMLHDERKIGDEELEEGRRLLKAEPDQLTEGDRRLRELYLRLSDGRASPEAFDATVRQARRETARAKGARSIGPPTPAPTRGGDETQAVPDPVDLPEAGPPDPVDLPSNNPDEDGDGTE